MFIRSEGCDFGYKCPLVLEELGTSKDKQKMSCYKCNKDVYVVNSMEQLKQYVELGRCVSFKVEVRSNSCLKTCTTNLKFSRTEEYTKEDKSSNRPELVEEIKKYVECCNYVKF